MMVKHAVTGTRWLKLGGDLKAEKGRILLMLAAIAVSVAAIGGILGAYAVLTREIAANYLGTHPAAATLELEGDANAQALELARRHPAVAQAEARDVLLARARVGADWRPLLLFVVEDFAAMRLNVFKPFDGAWPPPTGSMLIERTAGGMLDTGIGGRVFVKTPRGTARAVPVVGMVHDPGLAPAWQERTGYGYISRATLAVLGEAPALHELRIALRDPAAGVVAVEAAAVDLARQLAAHGIGVHEIRVPPPRQHPHQKQMTTILFLMLAFSVMALVLSSVLVANSMAAMLARQVREIGVMKTVGARTGQIVGLYVSLVAALGATAVAVAVPVGLIGASALGHAVAGLLNFGIADGTVPAWVFAVQACAGVVVPLSLALVPILSASRKSVREAINQHGAGPEDLRLRTAWLPRPARDALRRPARLALTLALLAAGGAMFMTALNVKNGWERNIAKVYETRHYDVEVRFRDPQAAAVAERLRELPGIAGVEAWGYSPAALAQPGRIDVVRTYPDRGHASFAVMAPPAATRLVDFPLLAGRWPRDGDTDAIVLNHAIAAQVPQVRVGERIDLSIGGHQASWRVVGIVEEIGSVGGAYMLPGAFGRIAGTYDRARMLRIATKAPTPQARIEAIRAIEQRLADDGVSVETTTPLAELRTAMADHIVILIRSLIAMATVMATVGALGLTSAMGSGVLERARELAVMKTLGATPWRVTRLVVTESLVIGASSWVVALLLAFPLTWVVDMLVGKLGFVAPLPFVIGPAPALGWLALVLVLSLAATAMPARRASRLSVAQALVQL